jgi:hypothetical protein
VAVAVLPGRTLDHRASDPELIDRTPVLSTRLGPQELCLLTELAAEFNTSRSNLIRLLLVEGLLELRDCRKA